MFGGVAKAIFGSSNDRYVRSIGKIVDKINGFEPTIAAMSDDELANQTLLLRRRLSEGEELDALIPEAFATVREAARRTLGQRHYDVQMIGGIVLHRGEIAEMRTGEGKTLVATLAVYLNALEGKGVHVVTVNDYLARRDADWMGQIYRFLGMTVGVIVPNLTDYQRRMAYGSDITYGTNNEFGFDYLRDNMKYEREALVQRPFNFAIVDEVDSILVDEARTPLIISGPTDDKSELYMSVDAIVKGLDPVDYELDEKQRSVVLTEDGTEKMERLLEDAGLLHGSNLYDYENTLVVHHLNQSLRANVMFKRDIDYIVKDGKVVIIDEFTGRMMEGRRWSDGLHQAVEAKEAVDIEPENQTMASITFQNYFRLYPKIGGMTGTAATEAAEFWDIYKLNVVTIPTNLPVKRVDEDDEFYRTERQVRRHRQVDHGEAADRPAGPVGTVSIEKSELLGEFLQKEGVKHEVLNPVSHEQKPISSPRRDGSGVVTIDNNMAGEGTDIQLGGMSSSGSATSSEMEGRPEKDKAIEGSSRRGGGEGASHRRRRACSCSARAPREPAHQTTSCAAAAGRQGDPGLSRILSQPRRRSARS